MYKKVEDRTHFSYMYASVLLYEPTSNKIVHCLELFAGPERFTFKRDAYEKTQGVSKNRVELGGLSSTLEVWYRYFVRFPIEIHLNIIVDIREFVRTRWNAYACTMQRFLISALCLRAAGIECFYSCINSGTISRIPSLVRETVNGRLHRDTSCLV